MAKSVKQKQLELLDKVEALLLVPKNRVKDWTHMAETKEGEDTWEGDGRSCRFCIYGAVNKYSQPNQYEKVGGGLKRILSNIGQGRDYLDHSFSKRWTTPQLKKLFQLTRRYIKSGEIEWKN